LPKIGAKPKRGNPDGNMSFHNMHNIRKIIIDEVLSKAHLMALATSDDDGVWISYVVYVFDDDLNIYWLSRPETRHSKAILQNPDVAGTISVGHRSKEDNIAIQFSGVAQKIEGDVLPMAIKHYEKRGYPVPQEGEILRKGESWYCAKPKFIDLTYEPLFGFNKQKLSF